MLSFPDSDQVLCEYEGDSDYTAGILTRTFVYGPGIDEPVRMSIMPKMDINGDGNSTMADVYIMRNTWLLRGQDTGFDSQADLNHDGVVNNIDADILAGNWKVVLQNAARYYYHFDGLGSVVALSDKNGQTVETYKYSVFGDTAIYSASGRRLAASAVGNVYFFTARRHDTETGLYHYRARIYSPHLGRFLQSDPIGYADGINWYLYCGNNPIVYLDPFGLCAESGNWWDYTKQSGKQLIISDYAGDPTLAGTIGQVAMGVFGVDVHADVLDIAETVHHWEWRWGKAGELALEVASLFPIVGVAKYGDEAVSLTKKAARRSAMRAADVPVSKPLKAIDAKQGSTIQHIVEDVNGNKKVLTHHASDSKHPNPHWHTGEPKMTPQGDLRKTGGGLYKYENGTTVEYQE
jgi:RHS repeat-associated protein